jgi:hypothetical protein
MRVDVSELKSRDNCGRQWQLSSRNAYHLKTRVPSENLMFGSIFHEALHAMYASDNPNIDSIIAQAIKEFPDDAKRQRTMRTMLMGYYVNVLPMDKSHWKVLDIEHGFQIPLWDLGTEEVVDEKTGEMHTQPKLIACGSIDMIVMDTETDMIWGIEHKTCANFRSGCYNAMDDQPKMYNLALAAYVDELNQRGDGSVNHKLGGIIVNEVRKLVTEFQYKRFTCSYTPEASQRFYNRLLVNGARLLEDTSKMETVDEYEMEPQPSQLKCQMCDYKTICETFGDQPVNLEKVLTEFQEEYQVRETDHLDEKSERKIHGDDE